MVRAASTQNAYGFGHHRNHVATVEILPGLILPGPCRVELVSPQVVIDVVSQDEVHIFVVRVEKHQEAVVSDAVASLVSGSQVVAIEKYCNGSCEVSAPVSVRHLLAIGAEPTDVGEIGTPDGLTMKEATTPEDGVSLAELNQCSAEVKEGTVHSLPIHP